MSDTAASVVRELRALSGQTQRALADAAGTAQSVVGRIEAGLTSPTVDSLERLARASGFELRIECVPARVADPVVEAYKPGVDKTLLIEQLRKTPQQRIENLISAERATAEFRRAGREARLRIAEAESKHDAVRKPR